MNGALSSEFPYHGCLKEHLDSGVNEQEDDPKENPEIRPSFAIQLL
jgi:hypothetical protein